MRRLLDRLYLAGGVIAGICLVLMALLILAQIVARWFGVIVPSTEDFSGFLLAAASFLALAYTLRSGGHISVAQQKQINATGAIAVGVDIPAAVRIVKAHLEGSPAAAAHER